MLGFVHSTTIVAICEQSLTFFIVLVLLFFNIEQYCTSFIVVKQVFLMFVNNIAILLLNNFGHCSIINIGVVIVSEQY